MEYIPQIINDRYVLFAAQVNKCHICKKLMVEKSESNYYRPFFPFYHKMSQDSQMERAGLVYSGATKVNNKRICVECEKSNKAYFKCSLCNEEKPTGKIKETIGDPPDFLCQDCYETLPAKVWDDKYNELDEEHKYDYE